jgi:hypothetical protein
MSKPVVEEVCFSSEKELAIPPTVEPTDGFFTSLPVEE